MTTNRIASTTESFPIVRWIAIGALALIALCALPGCKAKPVASRESNLAGAYNLVSVDGKPLPCAVAHAGSPTVTAGVFTLNPDGSCSSRIVMSTPSGGDMTREVKATYTRTGTKLTMNWTGAGTTTGDLSGDTFTMNNEGIVFAYRK